jgi:hypothetical protein
MGTGGLRAQAVILPEGGSLPRPPISHSRGAPGTGRNYQSRKPILQQNKDARGLAEMLLDSFHVPRVLPPELAALVALLKAEAERRPSASKIDDYPGQTSTTATRSSFTP